MEVFHEQIISSKENFSAIRKCGVFCPPIRRRKIELGVGYVRHRHRSQKLSGLRVKYVEGGKGVVNSI